MQSSLPPFETKSVLSLASLYVVRMLGLFMVLPVLALHEDAYFGSTPLLMGLAIGVYGLSQALLQIPFGVLSDRIGRKTMILSGLLLFGAGSVIAATADSIYGLIAGRFLQGAGAIASVIMALLTDLTDTQNRSKAMAVIGVSIGFSFTLSLILGPVFDSLFGVSGIFWFSALLAGVAVFIVLAVVPNPPPPKTGSNEVSTWELVKSVVQNRLLRDWNTGIFFLHFSLTALFVSLPVILSERVGLSSVDHWQIYLPTLVAAFVLMMPLMMRAERRGKLKELFIFALILMSVSALLIGFWVQTALTVSVALFLYFLGFNMLEVSLPSLMSKTAPEHARGAASGVYSSSQFFGAFVGSLSAGYVAQIAGISWAPAVVIMITAIWLVMVIFKSASDFAPQ